MRPRLLRDLLDRLTGRADTDLARELQSHLDAEADEQLARAAAGEGASGSASAPHDPAVADTRAARDAARRVFGSVLRATEDTRSTWRGAGVERVWRDGAYALRLMRRSPGFAAVVVISLALGIGANSAIFSVIDTLLLKPLPVKHPEQLYLLWPSGSKGTGAFSYPGFDAIRRANQVFSDTFNFSEGDEWNVIANGHAELTSGALVTGNYFAALGIDAIAGRLLVEGDDAGAAPPVAVISDRCWQRRFNRDPATIGTTIRINNAPFTIVGVVPPSFTGMSIGYPIDIWIPMAGEPRTATGGSILHSNGTWWLLGFARLKPGVTEAQARADLDLIVPLVRKTMEIDDSRGQERFARIEMTPAAGGDSTLVHDYGLPLRILMAIVGLVLLIACANVANLLLARASARRREIAIRLALGGGRRRLLQQLLVESLLLASMAGALGLVIAAWCKQALIAFFARQQSRFALDLPLDLRVLAFTLGISLLTGILFGLLPALRATRLDPGDTLKQQARGAGAGGGGGGRQPIGQALIVLQVAVSLLLVTGAGLFLRTLQNLRHVDLGFQPEHVVQMSIEPRLAGYDESRFLPLYRDLLERLNATPGVIAASGMRFGLIGGGYSGRNVFIPGAPAPAAGARGMASERDTALNLVGPRFFETLGIALNGREFTAADTPTSPKVVIVNEKFARYFFGTDAVIGRRIGFRAEAPDELEIVGVARDMRYFRMRSESPRSAFVPFAQAGGSGPGAFASMERLTVAVRTTADAASMSATLQRVMQAIARDVPVRGVGPLQDRIDNALSRERLLATLSSLFGGLALLLACIGLYGVLSYAIVRRTTEIGIRMALGARRLDVMTMVLRDSARLVLTGVALGLIAAVLTTRLIESQLFALKPTDPATLAIACVVLTLAAGAAALLPAWRAARVDPMIALRHD